MLFSPTALDGAWLLQIERRVDDRGSFGRTMCQREFAAHQITADFVQSNTSTNEVAGTLRGLHFQHPPHAEAKLVRCVRGAIFDVIVDLRPHSPTFRRWQGFELRGGDDQLLFVPELFAHGYQTLEPETEVVYQVSAFYAPGAEGGLRYDDPALAIEWPKPVSRISKKDATWPLLDASRIITPVAGAVCQPAAAAVRAS